MADIRDLKTAEEYIRLKQERKELKARINALEAERANTLKLVEAMQGALGEWLEFWKGDIYAVEDGDMRKLVKKSTILTGGR